MAKIYGTRIAGYAPPTAGPFKCSNCEYYSGGYCNNSKVVSDPALDKADKDGHKVALVEAAGCCTYFEPKD